MYVFKLHTQVTRSNKYNNFKNAVLIIRRNPSGIQLTTGSTITILLLCTYYIGSTSS